MPILLFLIEIYSIINDFYSIFMSKFVLLKVSTKGFCVCAKVLLSIVCHYIFREIRSTGEASCWTEQKSELGILESIWRDFLMIFFKDNLDIPLQKQRQSNLTKCGSKISLFWYVLHFQNCPNFNFCQFEEANIVILTMG